MEWGNYAFPSGRVGKCCINCTFLWDYLEQCVYETAVSLLLHSLFSFLSLIILLSSFPLTLTLSQSGFMSVSRVGMDLSVSAVPSECTTVTRPDLWQSCACWYVHVCVHCVCKEMRSGYLIDIVLHLPVQQQCPHAPSLLCSLAWASSKTFFFWQTPR